MDNPIIRIKKNDKFYYILKNKIITDENILTRIKKLRIPPAWEKILISSNENNHIQVIAKDTKNRVQYLYHKNWEKQQEKDKFIRLIYFSKNINFIRKDIKKILNQSEWSKEKLIAFIINIIDECGLRIGNEKYRKLYDSFGITTLLKKHINIKNNKVKLEFIGKKGVNNICEIKSTKNVDLFKKLYNKYKHNNNDYFFIYYYNNEQKILNNISVNDFIKDYGDFTIKDFRTFRANADLIKILYEQNIETTQTRIKKTINYCLDTVANKLNNTRITLKNKYICNFIIDKYNESPSLFIKTINKYKTNPMKYNNLYESTLIHYLNKYKNIN